MLKTTSYIAVSMAKAVETVFFDPKTPSQRHGMDYTSNTYCQTETDSRLQYMRSAPVGPGTS